MLVTGAIAGKLYFVTFPSLFHPVRAAGILLTAQSTGKSLYLLRRDCGCWGTPGGHLERGEAPLEAMARELREETRIPVRYRVSDDAVLVGSYALYFGTVSRQFIPELDDEHAAFVWSRCPPEPLHPGLRRGLSL